MKVDKYSDTILTLLAFSFYAMQGVAFILTVFSLIKCVFLIKKRDHPSYLTFAIDIILTAIFGYELYWLLNHI